MSKGVKPQRGRGQRFPFLRLLMANFVFYNNNNNNNNNKYRYLPPQAAAMLCASLSYLSLLCSLFIMMFLVGKMMLMSLGLINL